MNASTRHLLHRKPFVPACRHAGFFVFISACILLLSGRALAGPDFTGDTIAVFAVPREGLQLNALVQVSAREVRDAFDRLGRLMPVDETRQRKALEETRGPETERYRRAAEKLKADCYAVVDAEVKGNTVYGNVTLVPLSGRCAFMKQSIFVRSMISLNIPLKLAREVALLHKNLHLEADVREGKGGVCILEAGQWQGLSPGTYRTARGEEVMVQTCGRYQSIAVLPEAMRGVKRLTIAAYPRLGPVMGEIDGEIEYNTCYKYGLASINRGLNPEKRFVDALCIINPGANLILPGYGAFLATSYIGFKKTEPSIPGVVASSVLVIAHFTIPEFMGKFKINFFPGVMDRDKTADLNNLQIFCWASLPLTVSASFLDQIAYQCANGEVLPPFFITKNEAALALSAMIPGGGMFYKGYRLAGWAFYLSEMFMAGSCVYLKDKRKLITYGGIALGGVKLIELVAAFFSGPSYGFYKLEKEGRIQSASLSMDVRGVETGEIIYGIGLSLRF